MTKKGRRLSYSSILDPGLLGRASPVADDTPSPLREHAPKEAEGEEEDGTEEPSSWILVFYVSSTIGAAVPEYINFRPGVVVLAKIRKSMIYLYIYNIVFFIFILIIIP